MFAAILQEMRIRQYTKNAFVFAAPVFSGKFFLPEVLLDSILAFLAFSFVASAVYVGNDLMDREKDRRHPVKRHRPIAAGKISVAQAIGMIFVLLALGAALGGSISLSLLLLLMVYFLMNVAYSLYFKHVVILDVMLIAFGFVFRAFAGVIVAEAGATTWFILCVFMLSLLLSLAKRRGELVLLERSGRDITRKVLQDYSVDLLNMLIVIVCAVMLTSYALFSSSAHDVGIYGMPTMMLTVPLVVYGAFRYLYILMICGDGERPEEILLKDRGILLTVLIYAGCILWMRDI